MQYVDIQTVVKVARGLQELREKMVFVGGAVLAFYADDLQAEEFRPTRDIDLTVELAGLREWVYLQERLAALGFEPDASEPVICRYRFEGVMVDIMLADDSPFGVSNPWYRPAFPHTFLHNVEADLPIRLLPFPYLLATKFSAYQGRGKDPRTSHDFEDVVFLLNNRRNAAEEIIKAPTDVRTYLQRVFVDILKNPLHEELLACHISPMEVDARLPSLLRKVKLICNLSAT